MYALAPAQYFPLGLGDMQSAQQGIALGAAGAGTAAAIASAAGLIPVAAVPFIGPAIAGVTLLVAALVKNSGCGQTCIVTSQWANQAAELLDKNLHEYFAQPVRTRSSQQVALQNFDSIWGKLVSMCSDSSTGDAGKRCISDRQSGACVWRQTNSDPSIPGLPAIGECWNWFRGYRDPIANDPGVVADPSVSDQAESLLTSTVGYTGNALAAAGVPTNYVLPILFGAAVFAVWVAIK